MIFNFLIFLIFLSISRRNQPDFNVHSHIPKFCILNQNKMEKN